MNISQRWNHLSIPIKLSLIAFVIITVTMSLMKPLSNKSL